MAYTDFANVIRAPIWDGAKTGVFTSAAPSSLDYGALGFISPLPAWDGEKYAQKSATDPGPPYTAENKAVYDAFSYLFVATALFDTQDLYVDSTPKSSDNVSVRLYGSDGQLLVNPDNPLQTAVLNDWDYWASNPRTIQIAEDPETFQWRRVHRLMWADTSVSPTVYTPVVLSGVKAMVICGAGDYPQGRPTHLYGIYGIGASADVPFWTGFEGDRTDNYGSGPIWPYIGKRQTELF